MKTKKQKDTLIKIDYYYERFHIPFSIKNLNFRYSKIEGEKTLSSSSPFISCCMVSTSGDN